MTRRNTCALDACTGVLSADTHSGSIKSSMTLEGNRAHNSATDSNGAHWNLARCQPIEVLTSASLSRQCQP